MLNIYMVVGTKLDADKKSVSFCVRSRHRTGLDALNALTVIVENGYDGVLLVMEWDMLNGLHCYEYDETGLGDAKRAGRYEALRSWLQHEIIQTVREMYPTALKEIHEPIMPFRDGHDLVTVR